MEEIKAAKDYTEDVNEVEEASEELIRFISICRPKSKQI